MLIQTRTCVSIWKEIEHSSLILISWFSILHSQELTWLPFKAVTFFVQSECQKMPFFIRISTKWLNHAFLQMTTLGTKSRSSVGFDQSCCSKGSFSHLIGQNNCRALSMSRPYFREYSYFQPRRGLKFAVAACPKFLLCIAHSWLFGACLEKTAVFLVLVWQPCAISIIYEVYPNAFQNWSSVLQMLPI